jgi:hypothetical protein
MLNGGRKQFGLALGIALGAGHHSSPKNIPVSFPRRRESINTGQ